MKKILTILLLVFAFVSNAWAIEIKATVTPVLCDPGKSCTPEEGGEIGWGGGEENTVTPEGISNWTTSTVIGSYPNMSWGSKFYYIYFFPRDNEENYFEEWASAYNANGTYTPYNYLYTIKYGFRNWSQKKISWTSKQIPSFVAGIDKSALGTPGGACPTTDKWYAIFKPRAAYYDYAEAEVMVIDGTGKPLKDASGKLEYNGCTVHVSNCSQANGKVVGGLKVYGEGESRIKSFAATSVTYGGYTYTATAPQGYTFKGWYRAAAIDQSVIANGVADLSELNREASTSPYTMPANRYTTTTTYKQVEANNHCEKVPKLYAIFQSSFSLSRYVAANDEFAAMTAKVENGIYTYADPQVSPTAESLYQVDHAYGDDLKLSCTGDDFVATFDEIQGRTVIRVNPISTKETLSGVITFYTGSDDNKTNIATLTLTASNTPVFVTLLPADGYTGTYTYRQNTTGATEFPVTTSAVTKQLITATDYKFNFKPTPVDASKTKFDHWIIKKKNGSKEKSTTANLYKEFEGGETIQPVFIPAHRTTFIILSQPEVHYYDLQKALDAAANMQNPQDQVVTVYAPTSTTERLQYRKDGYTITKGVTFLIPGDAAYSNLMRDVTEDDFTRDQNLNSTSCYCKLSVDDNTNITVVNGNISIFSGLKAFQYDNGGRIKYGQLHLGKNCNITVQNGGLYAFGFITGDKSSQVIMEEGTTTYEVFNFKDARKITTTYELYNKRNTYKVFPIGQYYIQSIEVPLTLKYGATEWVSSVIYAGETMSMNLKFIGNTNDALFVLGDGTSVTKSYDPTTDRLKLKFEGSTDNSSVSTGNMNTKLSSFTLNSNEYVLPIQNNMDIEVKNTTINVTSDIALMPSSKLIVQENARININEGVSMFVYDYGARMVHQSTCAGGYWGALNNQVLPLAYKNNNPRPGGIFYRNTLTDATIILDGEMDVNGALYTVKGNFTTTGDPEGGANITSNGGGKINVNNIGTKEETYQYHLNYSDCKGEGFHALPFTSPNLLLRNDKTKNANNSQYTKVSEKTTYTYYQNEGVWRKDEEKLPISGIKLYDNSNKEIEQFYVTMPTSTPINGYILASLEKLTGVTYNKDASDFSIALESGNITLNSSINPTVEGDKLKIPVTYNVKNVHGSTTQTLTITNKTTAFTCNFSAPIKAQENYTPVFSVPSTVDVYARVGETVEVAAPIQCSQDNVASLIKSVNEGTTKWTATFTHKEGFEFVLGSEGQELSGARIKYTPKDDIRRTVTLTLKATYRDNEKDVNCCGQTILREHQVVINAYPSMIANTMEFNEVGVITKGRTFDLLRYVNSDGDIVLLDAEDNEISSINNGILSISANPVGGKPNFSVTTTNPGAVTVKVKQKAKGAFAEKIIEKTIVVTSNPSKLENGICLEDEEDFKVLTSSSNNVNYANGAIIFHDASSWTVQYEGVAGNISFTPTGSGYWAVEESRGDGEEWTPTSVYWTKLPSNHIVVNLLPTSRRVKISYSDQTGQGSLTDVCVNPLTINIEETKIYVPIINEKTTSTVVEFTHGTEELSFELPINDKGYWTWSAEKIKKEGSSSNNLGGVLNIYYKTKVTLTANSNVTESHNSVTLTATSTDSKSVSVDVATYNFPKPLPIYSTTWTQDAGNNGYEMSEYYYHYMVESSYVKWDEANQDVIFLNKGNDTDAKRQVVFGFDGMPDEVRFQSTSGEWLVEARGEDEEWSSVSQNPNVSTKTVGETQYWYKEISQTAKYVRITYVGGTMDEVVLNDLVIEGFPTAVARESDQINSAEVTEIILPDANSNKTATFYIYVKNLENLQLAMENSSGFTFTHGSGSNPIIFNDGKAAITGYYFLAVNKAGFIPMTVTWNAEHIVDEGYLRIQKPSANSGEPAQDLHVIHIVGKKDVVTKNDSETGIWTGVPDGLAENRPTKQAYQLRGLNDTYDPYQYHEVNVANAFDKGGKALFNYLVIYGETTTTDGSRIIYEADGSRGSNALTPYYIYERINETSYQLRQSVENANSPTKAVLDQVSHHVGIKGENEQMYYAIQPNDNDSVSFYMTGFCPYASTGSTMHDEGVWYFRGKEGSKVNIYLEDCHIYSRNKTVDGNKVGKYDEGVVEYTIDDGVVKGSGAVLVFEHMSGEKRPEIPFNVAIHTIGHNVFKSNYGAYLNVLGVGNVRAAQVSASVQVRLSHMKDSTTAYTNIDFDDKWPDVLKDKKITSIKRTNGFLSLQKQHNHAPSIDLGNRNTVVNFRGGRVELQNATVVSPNYKTTLAISHRSGLMGNIKDFNFSLGLGTDDVGGTVNFYDGTTTVKPMTVAEAYRDFYLMDEDDPTRTSCLRTPTNTFIYGGSHCMMRACKYVTSSGGAPKDRPGGNFLGLYKYPSAPWSETVDGKTVTHKGGWTEIVGGNGLVTIPLENLPNENYGTESITPNTNSTANDKSDDYLNLWVREGYDDNVIIEEDKLLTAWKASMTRIEAGFMEVNAGVGGVVSVNPDERITNLLYCQLDEYIHEVISEGCSDGECVYMAPVKDPTNGMLELEEPYVYIAPSHVGDSLQHSIVSEIDYEVTNKVYYVTTAKADTWMNFTLPFDVEKVHVVEAYREEEIEDYFNSLDKEEYDRMSETLRFQAKHNADFAAFFGMAMAMGDYAATFDDIYNDYTDWGLYVDSEPVKGEEDDGESNDDTPTREYYTGDAKNYDWRGMRQLTHYDGTNFSTSNYYLYKNNGDWTKFTGTDGKERFAVQWEVVPKVAPGETLMHKGETYSLLFPYCQGCDGKIELNKETGKWKVVDEDNDGYPDLNERDYWDYWSGKFIIFESTGATVNDPHEIRGSNYNKDSKVGNSPWIFDNVNDLAGQAVLSGNSTFHMMNLNQYANDYKSNIYEYSSVRGLEQYKSPIDEYNTTYSTIAPTNTFLLTNHSKPIRSIARDGRIVTDGDSSGNQGTTTGGNIPTVGGGHSMFITGVDGGINVAVATPQQVRVISATGTILYSGYVNDNVDIPLPINGIYIVKGETEVQKIFY